MNELLPIGSVVRRIGEKVPWMIIGYYPYDKEEKLWDYMGVNSLFGVSLYGDKLAFNSDSIEEILFTGFSDENGETYRKEIRDIFREKVVRKE